MMVQKGQGHKSVSLAYGFWIKCVSRVPLACSSAHQVTTACPAK